MNPFRNHQADTERASMFHSHDYATQHHGRFGLMRFEAFSQRRRIDQDRNTIAGYSGMTHIHQIPRSIEPPERNAPPATNKPDRSRFSIPPRQASGFHEPPARHNPFA